jgi:mercuric ion binding protein
MKLKTQNLLLVGIAASVLAIFALFVRVGDHPDSVVVLNTLGMTCKSCSAKITNALSSQQGVTSAEVDVAEGRVTVWYDSKKIGPDRLAQSVTSIGYGSSILLNTSEEEFTAMTGRVGSSTPRTKAGGCGGGCCANK